MFDLLGTDAPMINGDWLTGFAKVVIGAVFGGVVLLQKQRLDARRKQRAQVTIHPPMPEVPVRHLPTTLTWDHHSALEQRVARVEQEVKELRKDQADQFKDLLEGASERESRIFKKIDDAVGVVHKRLDALFRELARK